MEEKTLLAEIEKEQKIAIEKKFLENRVEAEKQVVQDKKINIFSANAFPKSEKKDKQISIENERVAVNNVEIKERKEIEQSKASSVIEKPNYDFIEELSEEQREKIFKIDLSEDREEASPKKSKFKMIVFSIVFAIFGVWGIVNIAQLDKLGSQIAEMTTEYNMNLISYLNNLHNLDATNSNNMENLFQTIPDEMQKPNTIEKQSNWFDRFCNFIVGLFGG